MSEILLIRHAPTEWNKDRRLQGLSDVPLSAHSREWIKTWVIPNRFEQFRWISSPLVRAKETADYLHNQSVSTSKLLREMDFGDWEGEALPALRHRLGPEMQENEDRGLDFTPPNGESPRMVQARLQPLFAEINASQQNTVFVSHHGVMRAIMALAFDWSMLGKAPIKFQQGHAYLFRLNNDLSLTSMEMHIPLAPAEVIE